MNVQRKIRVFNKIVDALSKRHQEGNPHGHLSPLTIEIDHSGEV